MDAQQFLAEFGHIANAPGGLARLRELVLQLAISGRLTERVIGDTSAVTLIEANRNRQKVLVAQRALKRQPDPKPVTRSDQPWILPDGWAWTRLGSVTNYGDAPKVELDDVNEDTWVLELEDIEKGTSKLLSKVFARERKFKSTKNGFPAGAVLYGKLRPYLDKVLIAESAGVCTTEISPISFFENIDAGYLRWYLKSPYFIAYADGSTYGMNLPRLGTDSAREALFPFPPIKEQSRIVAKVDELMTLCDTLEKQQQARRKLQNNLRQSILQAVASSQSPHELQTAWTRLAENFGRLFHAPEDVDELQGLVRDLAIRGLLTEQSDTSHETVVDTLTLELAREKLRKSKGIRATRLVSLPDDFEEPFQLPSGWNWLSLDQVCYQITDGAHHTPNYVVSGIPFLSVKDMSSGVIDFSSTRFISQEAHNELVRRCNPERGDVLLTKVGTTGIAKAIDTDTPFSIFVSVALLKFPHEFIAPEFLELLISSPFVKKQSENGTRGIGNKNLVLNTIKGFAIPLPPMLEQQRILIKSNQLLGYCQSLKTQLKHTNDLANRLASAAVSALAGITTDQEEEPMKAPLANILARHNGEMSEKQN